VPLGQALNSIFAIKGSDKDWQRILEDRNTLGNVCHFISKNGACRADCSSMKIAGKDCDEAGMFIALRSMLIEAGIPASGLRPSSELGPMLEEHYSGIVDVMARLAPGALPIPKSRFSERFGKELSALALTSMGLAGGAYLFLGAYTWPSIFVLVLINFLAFGYCGRRVNKLFTSDLHVEGIKTFGDLARFILQYRALTSGSAQMN
jgi:hypothetical protein